MTFAAAVAAGVVAAGAEVAGADDVGAGAAVVAAAAADGVGAWVVAGAGVLEAQPVNTAEASIMITRSMPMSFHDPRVIIVFLLNNADQIQYLK